MLPIFIGLAISNTIFLFLTIGTGVGLTSGKVLFGSHFSAALFTAFFTCLVHCVVFTYFIGTGRWVKESVKNGTLKAEEWASETKKLKAKTYPYALFSMMVVLITVFLGAGVHPGSFFLKWLHQIAAYFSLALNILSFFVEGKFILANTRLLQRAHWHISGSSATFEIKK